MRYLGALILRERLKRDWSQEGLCREICTVSYLSKIENGKAEPSEEILGLLFRRLGLAWSEEANRKAALLAQEGYELLFSGCVRKLEMLLTENDADGFRQTPSGLDFMLLGGFCGKKIPDVAMEVCMDTRQLGLLRLLQGRFEEAIRLVPCAYAYFCFGANACSKGSYTSALEMLQTAYDLAAKDGYAEIMLQSRLFMGNCYCNQLDLANMRKHYLAASRLAKAMGDEDALYHIGYNTAATNMECGQYEEAYLFFAGLRDPEMLSLHKLAICCEKTGRTEEALCALQRAGEMESDYPDTETTKLLCALVRYRVEHPDYLRRDAYGELLLQVFGVCQKKLPRGYATFHLPWVLEWCKASRQYKMAMELMTEFPENHGVK